MNIAIIGLGWWGPKLLRNFANHPAFVNVYGFDANLTTLKNRATEFQFQPVNSLDEIWENRSIDAVAIVTPVQTHYAIAREAFHHRKHVLVAKPPASTCEEVEDLGEIARKNSLVFMADSTFVYNDALLGFRDFVKAGNMSGFRSVQSIRHGDVMRMHHVSRIRNTMFANKINVIEDLIFHDLSVLTSLIDGTFRILSVHRINNLHPEFCDTAYIDLEVNGVHVHISYSWTLPDRKREIVLYCEDKFLVFDDLKQNEKVWLYHIESQKQELISYRETEPLQNVVSHFAECIERGSEPVTGIELMTKVMRLSRQIHEWNQ